MRLLCRAETMLANSLIAFQIMEFMLVSTLNCIISLNSNKIRFKSANTRESWMANVRVREVNANAGFADL